jgi:hypothetical protein
MHVYRWDLDRTYLLTEIMSVRGLIRTAFEKAADKRCVPGAPTLLKALVRADPTARVAIVSGSPTQMRAVLEEKLSMDGVRFDSLVLKDHTGNLRRGRLRAVTGQLGYKLPQLLKQRVGLGPGVRETLFGDDSEVDALVYGLYADAIAGRVGEADISRVMEAGGAYPDAIEDSLRELRHIGRADAVEDIFILLDRGTPMKTFQMLGPKVVPVFSWFQAALVLWTRGRLETAQVVEVARAVAEAGPLSDAGLAGLAQDVVRRRHVSIEQMHDLLDRAEGLAPAAPTIRKALERLGPLGDSAPGTGQQPAPDYLGFLRATR